MFTMRVKTLYNQLELVALPVSEVLSNVALENSNLLGFSDQGRLIYLAD